MILWRVRIARKYRATIRFLRRRNREGCDVYIYPYGGNRQHGRKREGNGAGLCTVAPGVFSTNPRYAPHSLIQMHLPRIMPPLPARTSM
jgi:hypothetical protein